MCILGKVSKGEKIDVRYKITHKENKNIVCDERKRIKIINKPTNILRKAMSNSLSNS